MDPTTTTIARPAGVLTSGFPSAGDMIGWAWSHTAEWVGAHWLVSVLGLLGAVVWYLGIIVRRAVVSV